MIKELMPLASPIILKQELEQVTKDLALLSDRIIWEISTDNDKERMSKLLDRRAILVEYQHNLTAELLMRYFRHLESLGMQ